MFYYLRVVIIKKVLFVVAMFSVLAGLLLVVLKGSTSPQEEVKQLLEEEQGKQEIVEEEEAEEEKEDVEDVLSREDPVREFLSEQLQKAIPSFFTQEVNVVTLGDSLTEGIGDETENGGYVGILESTINKEEHIVTVENFARRGSRSGQLLERLEDDEVIEAIEDAHIILMTVGANDIMQVFKENFTNLTLEQFTTEQIRYEQRLEAIFETIRSYNEDADLFLIGFYNPFQQFFPEIEELEYIVNSWNQIGSDVVERFDYAHFIPIKDLFDDMDISYLADDQFHPNHFGYRKIAERILEYVVDY